MQPPVFFTSAAMGRQGPLADAPELVTSVGGASSDGADASVASLDIAISSIVVVGASPTKSIHFCDIYRRLKDTLRIVTFSGQIGTLKGNS